MDIGDVSKASGLPPSALRFYEERGLISSLGRRGLRRYFGPDILRRLALISLGRKAGFSLDGIGDMLVADSPKLDRNLLLLKAGELDKKIKELERMRDGLRHAAVCQAPDHLECPKFLRLLRLAGKRPR